MGVCSARLLKSPHQLSVGVVSCSLLFNSTDRDRIALVKLLSSCAESEPFGDRKLILNFAAAWQRKNSYMYDEKFFLCSYSMYVKTETNNVIAIISL